MNGGEWLEALELPDWLAHLAAARELGLLGGRGVDVDAGLELLRAATASPGGRVPPPIAETAAAAARGQAARQGAGVRRSAQSVRR